MVFVLNITNDDDPIVFDCDDSYNPWIEIAKYVIQFMYLVKFRAKQRIDVHWLTDMSKKSDGKERGELGSKCPSERPEGESGLCEVPSGSGVSKSILIVVLVLVLNFT
ncbi:Protein CBG25720 [Caenorhabditis briggsae]|uniref:Protein CBG25720 n=1 Tax=Caenorhabditis briggsae TaxID=6238 RepID=B6IGY3_CAEBR|nr:Protein CBG25720 [Caenorhabditis briggsae]CAR99163.1 Protein CBG25720 [Caenorhabditis briggsae]